MYSHYSDEEMVQVRTRELQHAAVMGGYAAMACMMYSSQELKANGRERCGQQRGSKRSRRTRRHTRGQIDPIQQLVVEPHNGMSTMRRSMVESGCESAPNIDPALARSINHLGRRSAFGPHAE